MRADAYRLLSDADVFQGHISMLQDEFLGPGLSMS